MKAHYVHHKSGCCQQLNPFKTETEAKEFVENVNKDSLARGFTSEFVYVGFMTEDEAKKKVNW